MILHRLLTLCLLLLLGLANVHAQVPSGETPTLTTDTVHSRVIASHHTITPGQAFKLAWNVKLDANWHIYWRNPGDSGIAPQLSITDDRFAIGATDWPTPKVISIPPITNYGYETAVTFITEVRAPDKLKAGPLNLPLKLDYLYCHEVCLPGTVSTTLPLMVGAAAVANPPFGALEEQAKAKAPRVLPNTAATAQRKSDSYTLRIDAGGMDDAPTRFIPLMEGWLNDSAPQKVQRDGSAYILTLQTDPHSSIVPERLAGLVLTTDGQSYRTAPALEVTPASGQLVLGDESLVVAMVFAFLAGVILNLMPCVLPVLSLKVFALVQAPNARARLHHTLVYAGGVVASFWAFAIIIALLQRGGDALGWGFHLQNPLFVSLLATLMLVLGLNFLGVFEWGRAFTRLGITTKPGTRESNAHAFLTGLLAVIVATPCTVPFMGTAMAYALSQSIFASLVVFTMLGWGMAAPIVLIAAVPALSKRLPRPGAWMETLRKLLAWPLFATALWLAWVFGQQTGIGALAFLLVVLLVLSFLLWLYGTKPSGLTAAITVFWVLVSTIMVYQTTQPTPRAETWETWSLQTQEDARAQQPVFVDFTADWCLTCKVTEATVLNTAGVQELFAKHNVKMLMADWTKQDPTITTELARHNRRGVPLYLLYKPGAEDPIILPQLLSYGILQSALEQE